MNEYTTSDIGLAAFLMARGYELLGVEGSSRVSFIFPAEAGTLADSYYQGAPAPAITMARALRTIKIAISHAVPQGWNNNANYARQSAGPGR